MKKISVLAVFTLIFLVLLSGCRSTESQEVETIAVSDFIKPVFEPHVSVSPIEKEPEPEPIVQPEPEQIIEKTAKVVPEIIPDIEIVVENKTKKQEVSVSESVSEEPQVITEVHDSRAGLIILLITVAVALLSFSYYLFIFKKKVSK